MAHAAQFMKLVTAAKAKVKESNVADVKRRMDGGALTLWRNIGTARSCRCCVHPLACGRSMCWSRCSGGMRIFPATWAAPSSGGCADGRRCAARRGKQSLAKIAVLVGQMVAAERVRQRDHGILDRLHWLRDGSGVKKTSPHGPPVGTGSRLKNACSPRRGKW